MPGTTIQGTLRLLPARVDGLRSVPGVTEWRGERWDDQLALAMRVWPHHNDTGGFFVAVIEKVAEAKKRGRPVVEAPSLAGAANAVEAGPCLAMLERRFGIPRGVFDDYLAFRANAGTLSIVRRDLRVPAAPESVALGMPFFHIDMRDPRPTSGAAVKFGALATRNVLELEGRRTMDFVFGREIALGDGEAGQVDGPGYVIGRGAGCLIGVGRCWEEGGRLVVKGMVSKAWAEQLDDPGRDAL